MKITTVIITFNEENSIKTCVEEAWKVSHEVLIVDANSDDRTVELAESAGARVLSKAWEGYGQAKNFGNEQAKNDWILSLDADEFLTDELIDSIKMLKSNSSSIYLLDRQTFFLDKALRYSGFYPDWKARLFHRGKARWNLSAVHEELEFSKEMTLVKLKGKLFHHSMRSLDDFITKQDHYAHLGAKDWIEKGKNPGLIKRIFGPSFRFFKVYLLQKGFLDGKAGWSLAKIYMKANRAKLTYFKRLRT